MYNTDDNMEYSNKISILDLIIVFVKNKVRLICFTILIMIISYLYIFFFVPEEFDSYSLIIPIESNESGGISDMFDKIGGGLPFGISGILSRPQTYLFETIIYSRSNLTDIINTFNLYNDYSLDKDNPLDYEKALKIIESKIYLKETKEGNAYKIGVKAITPTKASNMANYIVEKLNKRIIELNIRKAYETRVFLGNRVDSVQKQLIESEVRLKEYQKYSGLFQPEDQLKSIITSYSQLEAAIFIKEIELSILKRSYKVESPLLLQKENELESYRDRLNKLKQKGEPRSFIISYDSIPENVLIYTRLLRDIEIQTSILKFILPLYEQSKLDEQKSIPVIQIIDYAIPPVSKSFPPRVIISFLLGLGFFFAYFTVLCFKENKEKIQSPKARYIIDNIFKLKIDKNSYYQKD